MYKTTKRIIASMLVLIITLAQLSLIGVYGKEVYATDSNLENQGIDTNNENVEFDAYFMMQEEKVHTATSKISQGNSIYAKINVNTTGYLKNAQIEFKDANFKLINQTENAIIQKIDEEKSIVLLNQIDSKKEQIIEIPIKFNYTEEILPSEFSKESKVVFTGTYLDKDGEENKIEKEIEIQQNWKETKEDMEAVLEENVTKFIPYTIGEEEGLLVQTTVTTSLTNNMLPIKTTTIEAKVPTINGIKPTSVKVYATSTKATNGQETGVNFLDTNYAYSQETNVLTIKVQNPIDGNGKIKWVKESVDEYKITYIYSKEVRDYVLSENYNEKLQLETKATLDLYTYGETTEIKTKTQEVSYKGQIGNIAEVSIESETQNLSKGYIYANYAATTKVETNYNQIISAEVVSVPLTDKIVIEQNEEYFVESDETIKHPTTVSESNNTYYKSISINKNIINKILGEDAEIKIYSGETLIETINSEKLEEIEDIITIDLSSKDINTLKIETSKPIAEGELIFNIEKAIKGTIDYTKVQMESVEKLSTLVKAIVNGQETVATSEILFTEPTSKAEVIIDKTNLSTVVKNEDVKIKAILKTDSIDNSLFKNPTVTIQLPKYIETIEIKDKEILFDKELTISSIATVKNTDGTQSIVVELKGEQTKYNIDSVTGGANIVITADLTVNKLTSNRTEELIMKYTNENETTAGIKQVKTKINFVAPVGVVTTASIEGYAEGKEKLTSLSGEAVIAELATIQKTRETKFDMSVINNYNNTIDSVKVLGRLPFKGNKDLVTGEDLKSTFDIKLKSAITVSGIDESRVTIYYSTNGDATADLNNNSNGWGTTVENYEQVKSYLIVVSGELNTADSINFSYIANIPEKLQYNETTVENYIVYFNNNLDTGRIQDKQLATPITLTTGIGPRLEVEMSSDYTENQIVSMGKYITYTVKIKNTGTKPAQNVQIKLPLHKYTKYTEYREGEYFTDWLLKDALIDVGTIEGGATTQKQIIVKVADITSNDIEYVGEVKSKVTVTADGIEETSNEILNKVKKPYFYITNNAVENYGELSEGEEFEFKIGAYTTDQERVAENTIIETVLPEGLTYQSATAKRYDYSTLESENIETDIKYNEKNRTLTANIGTVTSSKMGMITIKVKVNSLNEGSYKKVLKTYATVSADGVIKETSDIKEYTVTKAALDISQTSNIPNGSIIKPGDELSYIVNIKNIGERKCTITVNDRLPSNVHFKNIEYTINGETKTSTILNNKYILQKQESITIKINTVVGVVSQDTTINNQVIVKIDNTGEELKTGEVKHIIEKLEVPTYDGNEEENPDTTSKNRINGIVWKDENKNGIYDATEKTISGVDMLLLNADTNQILSQKVTTNENGLYTFSQVPNGNYIVVFLYDAGKYSATAYQVEGADESVDSDAIDSKIDIEGKATDVAMTNKISIQDSNIYNINLGLIDNPKFDLKIDKTISRITLQDPTGAKLYEYNNEKLAKVEFVEKYLGQSSIVVEYKITVTNQGAVDGFVKKIADYIPAEMSFSSELNRDWYMNENGTIYNSSLANTKIQPGESKEVTLVLTKAVNANSLGTINNTAEIYEAYNDQGIKDYDSTPGNKASNEDDLSSADIVLSIKTGRQVMFVGLTLTIISIIGISAYFIKKKVLI